MARKHEVEHTADVGVEESAPGIKTIGALLLGLPPTIEGVNVTTLPLGLLADFIRIALDTEISKAQFKAAFGIKERDEPERYAQARSEGKAHALAALSAGLLPSDQRPASAYIYDAAYTYICNNRDEEIDQAPDRTAAEAQWYARRMNDEERAELEKPRSQAKANCCKRLARSWISRPIETLPAAGQSARREIEAKGHAMARVAESNAQARVTAATESLLKPYDLAMPTTTPRASAGISIDLGF